MRLAEYNTSPDHYAKESCKTLQASQSNPGSDLFKTKQSAPPAPGEHSPSANPTACRTSTAPATIFTPIGKKYQQMKLCTSDKRTEASLFTSFETTRLVHELVQICTGRAIQSLGNTVLPSYLATLLWILGLPCKDVPRKFVPLLLSYHHLCKPFQEYSTGKEAGLKSKSSEELKLNKNIRGICKLNAGKETISVLDYLAKTFVFVLIWVIDDIPTAQTNSVILNGNKVSRNV